MTTLYRLARTPLRRALGAGLLGATLALGGLTLAPAAQSASAATTTTDGVYAGYYYDPVSRDPITTLTVTPHLTCATAEGPCQFAYLVHPIGPGGDWGTRQTATVSALSTQPLKVAFAPCALPLCHPLWSTTLTLTLTNVGVHVQITRWSSILGTSQASEEMTRLSA